MESFVVTKLRKLEIKIFLKCIGRTERQATGKREEALILALDAVFNALGPFMGGELGFC